jgi:hypothetical protein
MSALIRVVESSMGAGPVNRGRQILGKDLQDAFGWDTSLMIDLLDRLVIERIAQLIAVHWQILASAKPRFDLLIEATRAQALNKTSEIVQAN